MTTDDPLTLHGMILANRTTHLLYAAAELGLADQLRGGPRSSGELAAVIATHPDALLRTLRALAQIGVLTHVDDGRFALAPLGQGLRSDVPGSLRPIARAWGHPAHARAWCDLLNAVRTDESAFRHAFGMGLFEYFAATPEAGSVFNAAVADALAVVSAAVADAYDLGGLDTIVDVGGGRGGQLLPVLRSAPDARGVIFDLPHSADGAAAAIEAAGLAERCQFVAGDFFTSVPSGDAYLLRLILHDWDDERCLSILRNCRQAVATGGRLLVIEQLLPQANEPAPETVLLDMNMLVMTPGGRERGADEYARLFTHAGWRLSRVVPTETLFSILETVPV